MKEYTEFKTERVCITDLRVGMFVSKLDRPWIETSFPLEGVLIESDDDIKHLESICNFVFVDKTQSRTVEAVPLSTASIVNIRTKRTARSAQVPSQKAKRLAILNIVNDGWKKAHCSATYQVTTKFNDEVRIAETVVDNINVELSNVVSNIRREKTPSFTALNKQVVGLVESVVRNPDACGWLTKIHRCHNEIYRHTIRLAIWACIFGREVGLEKGDIHTLASALLLTGIGKSQLDGECLNQYCHAEPSEQYQAHLSKTIAILDTFDDLPQEIKSLVANYTERHNGSGYPNNKTGNDIPFLARVAGLIEDFELQLNPYSGHGQLTPAQAIGNIYKVKDVLFEKDIVDSFIQAIGIYPAGSLVELNDKSIAMVVSHERDKRLQAKVAVLIDGSKRPLAKPVMIDLEKGVKKWRKVEQFCISGGVTGASVPVQLLHQAHDMLFKQQKSWLGLGR